MKTKLLCLTAVAANLLITGLAQSPERLTISSAQLMPDYAKSMLLRWTSAGSNRAPRPAFVLGDLNNDERMDIVQAEVPVPWQGADTDLGVFLQASDGQFVKAQVLPIRSSCALQIFARDFNADGKMDLLANDTGNDMVLALGKGDGTFHNAQFLGLSASYYPAVGNLNGDAYLDLAVGASSNGEVLIFLGQPDGSFADHSSLNVAIAPRNGCNAAAGAIIIGDVNLDGKADVTVLSPESETTHVGSLHVFPGDGDGTFGNPIATASVFGFRGEMADFNGDGFLDYAGNRYSPAQLGIWLGRGDGSFAKGTTHSFSGIDPVAVNALDLNGDTIIDLTVAGEPLNGCCQTPLSIFLGKGDGTFRARQQFTAVDDLLPFNIPPQGVDFNRDGLMDLVTFAGDTNDAGITIALNRKQTLNPAAGFQMTIQTQTNSAIVLERSLDLATWFPLATNATPRGIWPVVDAAIQSRSYYRTVQR